MFLLLISNRQNMKSQDLGLLVLRIGIGGLMLFHGVAKLFHGVDGIAAMLGGKGIPEFIAYGVYVGEVIAPIFLIVGYRTRLAASVFIVNMLVIIFVVHSNDILAVSAQGGWKLELSGLYLLGALVLLFTGGGKFSVSRGSIFD